MVMMISIITPMYNEEVGIKENLKKLLTSLYRLKDLWELIIVDDGSRDNCFEIAKRLVSGDSRVRMLHYSENRGRGYALRAGFSKALGDLIATTESDLSWGPEIIGKLVENIKKTSADVVIASPYKEGGKLVNVPFHRMLLSKFGNKLMSLAVKGNLTMISGMTRIYKREVIDSLDLESDGKEIHLEIISKAITLGFKVVEIPAVLMWEKPGKRKKSHFNAKKFIFSHLLFSFNETPFMFLGTVAFILIALGIIGCLFVFYFWLNHTLNQHVFVSVSSIVFLVVGMQVLVFSFLANQNRDIRRHLVRLQKNLLLSKKSIKK